ncbi:MAG: AFG1 family ATPase, partial [Hyphomicrobiales bacterium]|nr:AFG1 family ATPase [Hyphomicrobiales bacterium]
MTVADLYGARVARGEIERDPAQVAAVAALDRVAAELGRPARPRGLFRRAEGAPVRGVYLHGPVGRGKTTLMDLLMEAAPVAAKRRAHFHAFMADVHGRVHAWRRDWRAGRAGGDDPIPPLADALASGAKLLCLDEFCVIDIADAMILSRLFGALFARGTTLVATSNAAPDELYPDGLNRALFLPFVALLKERCEVVRLDARTDFRGEKLAGDGAWIVPADASGRARLDEAFRCLTGRARGEPARLRVFGRDLAVREAVGDVARMPFEALCEAPLGAADYLALARAYGTLMVDDVPRIEPTARHVARRFILLVDALYDAGVKLVATAAAAPGALFSGSGNEGLEFARTASRLGEMSSPDWMARP